MIPKETEKACSDNPSIATRIATRILRIAAQAGAALDNNVNIAIRPGHWEACMMNQTKLKKRWFTNVTQCENRG